MYIAKAVQMSDKVFIHGLWIDKINILLTLLFWNLKKCHLAIWGGDLYYHIFNTHDKDYHKKERYRKFVFKHIGYIIPVVDGDYKLAKEWYQTQATMLQPFMYVGFYEQYKNTPFKQQGDIINIQIGNSATDTNHHLRVLDLLQPHSTKHNFKIFAPLSYGDLQYAKEVKKYGIKKFGDNFIAIDTFMPIEKYKQILHDIDIAIFDQNRQQGMGNIMLLLMLGKKIYLRQGTTHYDFLLQKGFVIFDIKDFNLQPISIKDSLHNRNLILQLYSKEKQIKNQQSFYS